MVLWRAASRQITFAPSVWGNAGIISYFSKTLKFEKHEAVVPSGDYASVYRIRKKAFGSSFVKSKRKYYAYAVKVPNPDDHEAEEAAEHEMTVMSAAKDGRWWKTFF